MRNRIPRTLVIASGAALIAMTIAAYGGGTVITGPTAVPSNSVTDAKLRDSTALSVIGRASNTTGDPADITAGVDGYVLRRSGTTLGFGTIPISSVTGAVSNSAGANVIAKSDGTNLVASNASDNGTTWAITEGTTVTAATGQAFNATLTSSGATSNTTGVAGVATGTLNATAADRFAFGIVGQATAARSAGGFNVINAGVYGIGSGGQFNYAGYFDTGGFYVTGAATFNSTFAVNGNTTLGDAFSDTTTINGVTTIKAGTSTASAAPAGTVLSVEQADGTSNYLYIRGNTSKFLAFGNASTAADGGLSYDSAGSRMLGLIAGNGAYVTIDGANAGAARFYGSVQADTTLAVKGNTTLGDATTDTTLMNGTATITAGAPGGTISAGPTGTVLTVNQVDGTANFVALRGDTTKGVAFANSTGSQDGAVTYDGVASRTLGLRAAGSTRITISSTLVSTIDDVQVGDAAADKLVIGGSSGPIVKSGSGAPETVVTAPVGSLFLRTDGSTGTSLYIKESGSSSTGWVAAGSTSTAAASLSIASAAQDTVTLDSEGTLDFLALTGNASVPPRQQATTSTTTYSPTTYGGWLLNSFQFNGAGQSFSFDTPTLGSGRTVTNTNTAFLGASLSASTTVVRMFCSCSPSNGWGFQLHVPATTTSRTLIVRASHFSSVVEWRAHMTDGSIADVTTSTDSTSGTNTNQKITVTFKTDGVHGAAELVFSAKVTSRYTTDPNISFGSATLQ